MKRSLFTLAALLVCFAAGAQVIGQAEFPRLGFAGDLAVDKRLDFGEFVREAQLIGRVHHLEHHVIVYSHVAGSLVSHIKTKTASSSTPGNT